LTNQPINNIQDSISEARLAHCPYTSSERERPEHREGNNTNCTNSSLVDPSLLTNHRQRATRSALDRQREGSLHTNQRLKITALLQLNEHLIFVANLLGLVALCQVNVHQVVGKSLNINFFTIVKSCIHPISSPCKGIHVRDNAC